MTTPQFNSIAEAIAWWEGRDQSALVVALEPPCDRLGDPIYDVMLAVFFKNLILSRSTIERIAMLQTVIGVHSRIVEQLNTVAPEHQPEAADNLHRIEAMLAVVRKWTDEIVDAGAASVVQHRKIA